jgi:hypothetical protein
MIEAWSFVNAFPVRGVMSYKRMVTKKVFVIKRGMGEKTIAKSGWAPVTGIGMDSQHGKGMGMKFTATSEKLTHYL